MESRPERYHGHLFDAHSHQQLRLATREEAAMSARAREHDPSGGGVIVLGRRIVYVAHEARTPHAPTDLRLRVRMAARPLHGEPAVLAELHPSVRDRRPLTLEVDGVRHETEAYIHHDGRVQIVRVPGVPTVRWALPDAQRVLREQFYRELGDLLTRGVQLARGERQRQVADPYRTEAPAPKKLASAIFDEFHRSARRTLERAGR